MRKAPICRWLPGVSRRALATLLLAAPATAFAAGFAGTTTLPSGVTSANSGNTQTITITPTNPVTTLTWTPTNAPVNGTVNFLPAGNTEAFVGTPSQGTTTYTVLNRIISSDPTNVMGFYGTVTSTANTRLWFYSPGGLLIGSTASFNVGGLVLTTAAPTVNPSGSFITQSNGTDSFGFASPAGSTSAITIQPGARINAVTSAQSNYIVAIAPQINQGGTIGVTGSAALVAAESATFAVDSRGLFNISVSSGTTVANNTFVHTGSTGGPNGDPSGSYQRVYMVAVPKNNAISMSIAAGGSIGFAVADAANLDGNEIVLSAGSNIADTGSGNPVVPGRAGSGTASLTVGEGTYTSNAYAVSTDSATITDLAMNISFGSNLSVIAPTAEVFAQAGTLSIGGNLTVSANNGVDGATESALVEAGTGATLQIGANAAALGVNGNLTETADDTIGGVGGTATLQANGSITVAGNALVSASGSWSGTQNDGNTATQGGTALVSVVGGGMTVGGSVTVNAIADGTGAEAALISPGSDQGVNATGGSASVNVSGASASLTAARGIAVDADAVSGVDGFGDGGSSTGGTALIEAQSGGALGVGLNGPIAAAANAAPDSLQTPEVEYSIGGNSAGGAAQVIANGGTITVAGVEGISATAYAIGGSSTGASGSGGSAIGGVALIATQGSGASISTNTSGSASASQFSTTVVAYAQGGAATGFLATDHNPGGDATGGTATIQVTGAGQSIAIDRGAQLLIDADATGGTGFGLVGGTATGGTAQLLSSGGSLAITNTGLTMNASAQGGSDDIGTAGSGGDATGGTVKMAASGGGSIDANIQTYASASATAGAGSGNGGNALGGNIFITLGNNDFNFDGAGQSPQLDASFTAGTGQYGNPGTAASGGGVLVTDLGTVTLAGALTIDENTPLYVQADGAIAVPGSITDSGTGGYLHLWADDLGTGTGTVTLASGALHMPGDPIDIYYNPTSLGTPTDFSAGISSGTVTAYQLVDNIDQLQLVGSYLSQNFALGKNIDASATAGWNDGAGLVPIGSNGNAFTGNFDGLNHAITNLYINTDPNQFGFTGLFGEVNVASNNVVIRNLGLTNENVTGPGETGGLIGYASAQGSLGNNQLEISNVYNSGIINGSSSVGGLIGFVSLTNNNVYGTTLSNSHSDADVIAAGGGQYIGGLIGYTATTKLQNVFATGSVTATGMSSYVGGLLGFAQLVSLNGAYATGAVSVGASSDDIGGLVGFLTSQNSNTSQVGVTYATGPVTAGTNSTGIGGLVGLITSQVTVNESWASGEVSAPRGTGVGGFVGQNGGTITNSYWDSYSTGQANGVGIEVGTPSQLDSVTSDPTQSSADNYAFNPNAYNNFSGTNWVYDNDETRPVGAWEVPVGFFGVANIQSAHQVQLIDFNLNGSYTVTQNIDMRGTGGTTDIWDTGGFMPLGGEGVDPPFTGTLAGAGHVLSNLTMAPGSAFTEVGLVQENDGTISDLGLANVNITATFATDIGAIAGFNAGRITDSFATGTITLTQMSIETGVAGGLVGQNYDGALLQGSFQGGRGSIAQSYATVAISGGGAAAGGLVGNNGGGISGSFANGLISDAELTGGLVGESTDSAGPTITNSYWDTEATGQSLACGSAGFSAACSGVTGLTTAQTLLAESFPGFSIDTSGGQGLPWRQYEGQTTPLLEAFLTPITVQVGSVNMQYDAQLPDVGVTTYGAQPSLTFGTAQIDGLTQNAGTGNLTYAGGLYSNQLGYDFVPSTTPGSLVITPAPLTIGATSDYKTYDGTTNAVNTDGVFVSGTYGNDFVSNLSESFTSKDVMGQNGSTLVVNSGYVINDGNGGNNYTVTLQSAQGTIVPAPLTLAAVSDSKVYDATTDSAGVVQVSGLFGADNVSSLTQSFTSKNVMGANGSTLAVNSGYVVNDGNGGGNYTVTLQDAAGTITPAALAITYTANPATIIYGTTPSGLSGSVSDSGLQGSDTLAAVTAGTAQFTTTATAQSNAGQYAINGSGLTAASDNYSFNFVQAPGNATALTINPAILTVDVIADAQSRSYGAANPALTYTETGLVNGDMLTGSLATTATVTSNVGIYPITQGTLTAGSNYTLNYTGANLTVTPANLTVTYTANALSSIYGNAVPTELSGSASAAGLVNGDTLESVTTGAASFATTATSTSNAGAYAITGSGLSGDNGNYSVSFVQAPGNATALTIAPRPITVTADPQQRPVGAANPVFTYVVTSGTGGTTQALVNGDTLSGQLTTTATADSPPGKYDILQGTLAASPNYQLTYVGNILTLTFASLSFQDVIAQIETDVTDQPDINTPDQRRKQIAAELAALLDGLGLHPLQMSQNMINDRLVTTPPPVTEPVTSNGNSSLWSPGAP